MTNLEEAVLCSCGNLIKVEEISQFTTLVFLCNSCIMEMEKAVNISYENGEI
jgi:hypothetical protein